MLEFQNHSQTTENQVQFSEIKVSSPESESESVFQNHRHYTNFRFSIPESVTALCNQGQFSRIKSSIPGCQKVSIQKLSKCYRVEVFFLFCYWIKADIPESQSEFES